MEASGGELRGVCVATRHMIVEIYLMIEKIHVVIHKIYIKAHDTQDIYQAMSNAPQLL